MNCYDYSISPCFSVSGIQRQKATSGCQKLFALFDDEPVQQQTTKKKKRKKSFISQACFSDPHLQPQLWGLDLSWSDVGEGGGEEDSADHPDERGGQTKHPVHGRPILEIEIELILKLT